MYEHNASIRARVRRWRCQRQKHRHPRGCRACRLNPSLGRCGAADVGAATVSRETHFAHERRLVVVQMQRHIKRFERVHSFQRYKDNVTTKLTFTRLQSITVEMFI
ncbi:hypothetical protein EVAR_77391_1 [Eumeta japonica]|uniref:Uncharacterized protein n=1 Tax=Eumeta variegata TaxID=151549 RepID=A0A4C1UXC3_EUMVA|nr:hypothetical protein EVAR_77391_1 [Eumeta japonica]